MDWTTPDYLFDKLNDEFHFDLDVCASVENHKCEEYYTIEQDGLKQDWGGRTVFCNPPYERGELGKWVQKCYLESMKPGTLVVMLVPANTDTKWFHNFVLHRSEVRFLKGRIKFGGRKKGAPFGVMVVIYRGYGR